jgi:hypothetical protein
LDPNVTIDSQKQVLSEDGEYTVVLAPTKKVVKHADHNPSKLTDLKKNSSINTVHISKKLNLQDILRPGQATCEEVNFSKLNASPVRNHYTQSNMNSVRDVAVDLSVEVRQEAHSEYFQGSQHSMQIPSQK